MKKIFTLSFLIIFNIRSINTVDENNKGNWYEKLNWWKKSKPKYESLAKSIIDIKKAKKDLENKYKQIISKFDNLIKNLNLDQAIILKKIDQKLIELNKLIEKEYDQDDQDLLNRSNETKNSLEKLRLDFKALILSKSNLDKSILYNLENQSQLAENYEESALHSFEEMENILDDKKAKVLYEIIENANENINIIKGYITGSLKDYVDESEKKINQLGSNVENTVKNLESNNIYLREITEKKEVEKGQKKVVDNKKAEENLSLPWYKKVYKKIIDFFKKVVDFLNFFLKKGEKCKKN